MNSCSNRPDRRAEISRAQRFLLGQLAGDALGSLVEFQTPEQIRREYPNGAMMRISPLGIFDANHDLVQAGEWARQDAALTHLHQVCRQANALFAMAIAHAIRTGIEARALNEQIVVWADVMSADDALMETITGSTEAPPAGYVHQQGWALIAFRNTLWQLHHAPNLEEAVVDTVMRGGDTDTNAAICGALLGAVLGRDAIPAQWTECLLNCRPETEQPHVCHPRPECLWPVDALELAERLIVFD